MEGLCKMNVKKWVTTQQDIGWTDMDPSRIPWWAVMNIALAASKTLRLYLLAERVGF